MSSNTSNLSRKKKYLYSKATRPPHYPFHIVVKQQKTKRVLYITYGRGRKYGGGAWSENINSVHIGTYNMIRDHLGESVVEDVKKLIPNQQKEDTNEPI